MPILPTDILSKSTGCYEASLFHLCKEVISRCTDQQSPNRSFPSGGTPSDPMPLRRRDVQCGVRVSAMHALPVDERVHYHNGFDDAELCEMVFIVTSYEHLVHH